MAQDCDFEFEILVHDDASSDDSLDMLSRRYPRVEVLASAKNVGFCVANNRMVAKARGQYVLLLNNDAALFQDALSSLMETAQTEPNSILTLPQYDWEGGELIDRGCLLDPFYNPVPNLDPNQTDVAMVIGACLWIARSDWDALGGFPAWLESIGEDLYLCCAARLTGRHVRALPNSGYRHRQGHSFGGNKPTEGHLLSSYRRRQLSERNKTFVLFVMTPTPLMWLLLALHLLILILEGFVLSMVRRDARIFSEIYGNVFAALLFEWKGLWQRRVGIRRNRAVSPRQYLHGFTTLPRKLSMLWRYGWPKIIE
jgi:GT2 family glycosyltransferase